MVATAPYWRALEAALARAGIDTARAQQAGSLLVVDARGVLSRFLAGDGPGPGRFESAIFGLIRRAAAGGRPVRVFGEMAGVLRREGHVTLAAGLEARWNGLGTLLPFALWCGYPGDVTAGRDTAEAMREVCGLHPDVIATRSFPRELDSVRAARHFAAGLLGAGSGGKLAENTEIVVTELAANAVLHARSGFTLTISRSAAVVRIAVQDGLPLVSRNDDRPFDIKAGHGLSVVAQLASAWSVERLPDGKVVWVELAVSRG